MVNIDAAMVTTKLYWETLHMMSPGIPAIQLFRYTNIKFNGVTIIMSIRSAKHMFIISKFMVFLKLRLRYTMNRPSALPGKAMRNVMTYNVVKETSKLIGRLVRGLMVLLSAVEKYWEKITA